MAIGDLPSATPGQELLWKLRRIAQVDSATIEGGNLEVKCPSQYDANAIASALGGGAFTNVRVISAGGGRMVVRAAVVKRMENGAVSMAKDARGTDLKVGDKLCTPEGSEYGSVTAIAGGQVTLRNRHGGEATIPERETSNLYKMDASPASAVAFARCSCPCGRPVQIDAQGRMPSHRDWTGFCAASDRQVARLDGHGRAVLVMMAQVKTIGDVFGSIRHKGECGNCGHHFMDNSEKCVIDPSGLGGAGELLCLTCARSRGLV